jgi:hypothetical protein
LWDGAAAGVIIGYISRHRGIVVHDEQDVVAILGRTPSRGEEHKGESAKEP